MHLWTAYITIIVTCCWFNFFVKLAHCSYQGTKSPLCQSLHVSHYVRSISLSILIIWGCALNSAHFHPPDWGYSTNPKFHSTSLMCLKARRAFMPSCSAGAHSSFFFFFVFFFASAQFSLYLPDLPPCVLQNQKHNKVKEVLFLHSGGFPLCKAIAQAKVSRMI